MTELLSFSTEHTPVDCEGGLAERAAMVGERVEEGVCGRVVSLGRVAEDAGNRGEHDEGVEVHVLRGFMQQPRAVGLGSHDGAESLGSERGERGVVDDHREVENPLQRDVGGADFGNQAGDVGR
jgi:hypothetical protein